MTSQIEEPQNLPAIQTQKFDVEWWNPTSFTEALSMAEVMSKSQLVPKDYRGQPANIVVAWQLGAPLGLNILAAMQNIAVINGRPSVWGDGALAICRAHPKWVSIEEEFAGEEGSEDFRAICVINRKDEPECRRVFSVTDAKRAALWGKDVWAKYPKRMLQMRARSWAMRDAFTDALSGMQVSEESRDMVDITNATTVTTEPLGGTATERLKNKLRPQDVEVEEPEIPDEEFEQEEPKPKAKRKRKAKTKAKAKAAKPGGVDDTHGTRDIDDEEMAKPEDGMGGEQPELPENISIEDGQGGDLPTKTVEDFIAEAKTSEDLTRLNEEVRHRYEGDEITKQRQMELVQLIHNRSLEIAKGK